MSETHETLAEFVSRIIREKELSFRKVADRSGHLLSHSTVADIANGQRVDIKKDTLIALAAGLGVPADDIFRAARGLPTGGDNRFEIYAERFDAHDLGSHEWEFLEQYFKDHVDRWKAEKAARQKALDKMIKGQNRER